MGSYAPPKQALGGPKALNPNGTPVEGSRIQELCRFRLSMPSSMMWRLDPSGTLQSWGSWLGGLQLTAELCKEATVQYAL